MKYSGTLATLSVMAAFVAFSSESMALRSASTEQLQCTIKNCQNLASCAKTLDTMDRQCKIKTTVKGNNITATVNNCSSKFINDLKKNGCGDCKIECNM